MTGCICSEVYMGSERTNLRNIQDDCPEHGVGSEYYKGRVAFWNARLRLLREKRGPSQEEIEE